MTTESGTLEVFDYDGLDRLAADLREAFATAEPYPHAVIDDFLPLAVAEELLEEFERTERAWKHYHHYNERKLALTEFEQMPPTAQRVFAALQSQRTVDFVTKLKLSSTNYQPLPGDPPLRRLMIGIDRVLLRLYTLVKGHTKISDRLMDRLLKHL